MTTDLLNAQEATKMFGDRVEFVGNRFGFGDNVFIGPWTHLSSGYKLGTVFVGSNTLIGHHCSIVGVNHNYKLKSKLINEQGMDEIGVVIDSDVWIGANCVILPGVHIAKGAVIGAGSVVTKNVPSYEVWAGNPAKKIKERK